MISRKFLNTLGKWLASMLLVIMSLGTQNAFADGVPLHSYDQASNYIDVNSATEYFIFWTSQSYGKPYLIYTSPYLNDPSQFYSNSILADGTYTEDTYYIGGSAFHFMAEGTNDGRNWVQIGSSQSHYYSQSSVNFSQSINFSGTFKQIRVYIICDYTNAVAGRWKSPSASVRFTSQVYSFVADQQTVEQARDAANNTVQYAQQAANAANAVNTIINSTLTVSAGVVQDSSGTVLSAARQARDAANQANTGINDLSNKIDSNQQALSNQLSDLKNSVTNNFNNLSQFLTPSLKKISGVNGATATSGSSIRLVLDYSNATDYRYSVDGGAWSTWSPLSGNQISVPLGSPGAHTITVQVRNGNSDTAPTDQASMSVFKL